MTSNLEWRAPRPGSWMIDRAHTDRPRCRYLQEMVTEFPAGFRAGFRHFGALLDTIDFDYVHGFAYLCPRPLGGPAEPKRPPPKFVVKLALLLVPELRRRVRRSAEVFEKRLWRADIREFHDTWFPATRAVCLALQRVELTTLSDAELAVHLDAVRAVTVESLIHHFRINPGYMIAVGDFLVHAEQWTGASRSEILAVFEGASPVSREGADLVRAIAEELARTPERIAEIRDGHDPAAIIASLRSAEGPLGLAVAAWIDVVGCRIFTGFDLSERVGLEQPTVLLASLRVAIDGRIRSVDDAVVERRTAALRERVDPSRRAEFDGMLEDARAAYGLRDAHSAGCEMWTMGLGHVALVEVGRRLADRDLLHAAEHVFDLGHAEILGVLEGSITVIDADGAARYSEYRATATVADAPSVLGPPAIPPPPAEWLPRSAARMARAVAAYLGSTTDESDAPSNATLVRGLSASGGRHVGIARVVLDASDFDRLAPGDVLIARITTPAYNVVLPLLGGVVTDRGGVLSHPAIVAREYGIPGVVGTRTATTMIPDGATVEIDGDAGTVKVLE